MISPPTALTSALSAARLKEVQKGDSLWKIAKNLLGDGKRWTEIAALNQIENTVIHTGQFLKLPLV